MDPQLRDQLEDNDLAVFISNLGQWWGKHGGRAIAAALVVSVVILGKQTLDKQARDRHEQAWSDLATATSPDVLRHLAETTHDEAVRVLAYLRGGDLLLIEASKAGGDDTAPPPEASAGPIKLLEQAEQMYQRVIDSEAAHPTLKLNAHLGLAAALEGRSDWEGARRQYEAVLALAGPAQPAITATARARRDLLPRVAQPVHFAPASESDEGDDQPAAEPPTTGADAPSEQGAGDNPSVPPEPDPDLLPTPGSSDDGGADAGAGPP